MKTESVVTEPDNSFVQDMCLFALNLQNFEEKIFQKRVCMRINRKKNQRKKILRRKVRLLLRTERQCHFLEEKPNRTAFSWQKKTYRALDEGSAHIRNIVKEQTLKNSDFKQILHSHMNCAFYDFVRITNEEIVQVKAHVLLGA